MAKETQHGTNPITDTTVADTYGATDAFADGGIDVSSGFNPNDLKGAQALPTKDVSAGDDGQFNYVDSKFDSAPWTESVEAEGSQRPTLPNIQEPGSVPDPYAGFAGNTVDWDSVAPYKYPEFPADSIPESGYTGALRSKNPPLLG